jgi:hypothetical protein
MDPLFTFQQMPFSRFKGADISIRSDLTVRTKISRDCSSSLRGLTTFQASPLENLYYFALVLAIIEPQSMAWHSRSNAWLVAE